MLSYTMTNQTTDTDRTQMRISAYRARTEAHALAAQQHELGALNAAGAEHARYHYIQASRAAHEAHAARRAAREIFDALSYTQQQSAGALITLMMRDINEAAETASRAAQMTQTYANHPTARRAARDRADLELVQATAAYIQARRARQEAGAQAREIETTEAEAVYLAARAVEHAAHERLTRAQYQTETDPDGNITAADNDNPDAPHQYADIDEPQPE